MTTYTPEEKSTHISLWRESTMSKKSYANEAGIKYKTFLKWFGSSKPNLKTTINESRGFIPVSVSGVQRELTQMSTIELYYPNGVHLSLPSTIEVEFLKSLLD